MTNKLIIGTANFGLRYGIANDKKLSNEEAFAILEYAEAQGIRWIDTARAYGDAENVIGSYFEKCGKTFKVISKLPDKEYSNRREVENEVDRSMENMKVPFIDVLLIHSYDTYKRYGNIIVPVLKALRQNKVIGDFGVSVYHPEEVGEISQDAGDKMAFEFPLNLFDQRFSKDGFMQKLKSGGSLLFARSVFLQGLFFLKDNALNGRFGQAREKISRLRDMSSAHQMRTEGIALLYAVQKTWVDGVVVGVDSIDQLRSNIECLGPDNFNKFASLEGLLSDLAIDDEDIILPYRWHA